MLDLKNFDFSFFIIIINYLLKIIYLKIINKKLLIISYQF